jgi:lipopolysaccharide transport system permease protein
MTAPFDSLRRSPFEAFTSRWTNRKLILALEWLPERFAALIGLRPRAMVVERTRGVLFRGQLPSLAMLSVQTLAARLIAWLGYMCFAKTRKGLADAV